MNIKDILRKASGVTLNMLLKFPEQDVSRFGSDAYKWGNWDWSTGVALYGLIKANEKLSDENIESQIKKWIDSRINNGKRKICINTVSPMLAVMHLNGKYKEECYENICRIYDEYLMKGIQRINNGAFNHTTVKKDNPGQAWVDTLFMSVIYLSLRGASIKNEAMLKESVNQIYSHYSVLLDEKSSLFYHGYDDIEKKKLGVKWGRGNAWVTAATIDILINIDNANDCKKEILDILHRQLSSLAVLQDDEGFWTTVLDDSSSYRETTVTAGVSYGILKGIRSGLIDKKYRVAALKAADAVISKINNSGIMLSASSGTYLKNDADAYKSIPFEVTAYSQGLLLLALSELTEIL